LEGWVMGRIIVASCWSVDFAYSTVQYSYKTRRVNASTRVNSGGCLVSRVVPRKWTESGRASSKAVRVLVSDRSSSVEFFNQNQLPTLSHLRLSYVTSLLRGHGLSVRSTSRHAT
jgi:hypothetical protein